MTRAAIVVAALLGGGAAAAQSSLDRVDPSVVEDELRRPEQRRPDAKPPLVVAPARPATTAASGAITVGAIRIDGATVLPQSAFAGVIERYAGRRLTQEELQALAGDIANVARAAGFGLATAGIPQQRVSNGILRVLLDEGRIDEVRAEGDAAAAVNRMLAPLADGRPVPTARLERQLMLAGDLPGVSLGRARLDRRNGRNVLRLRAERQRVEARVSLDNWGTRAIGPLRGQVSLDVNTVFTDADRLVVGGVVTPVEPAEFALVRAEYSTLLGRGGTQAAAYGYLARSRPGGFGGQIEGGSDEGAVALSHQFRRSRASVLRGELEFAVREAFQDFRAERVREDQLATVTAGAMLFGKLGEGRGRLRLAIVQGLNVAGATREGDPLASRRDAGGVFTKIEGSGYYGRPLGGRFSIQLQAEGQIASRPLLFSEEIGLGGRYFLRGYDYRELSGDSGIAGSAELRYDLAHPQAPVKATQLYVYADAGTVGNLENGSGGGSLASAGGGARLRIGRIEASFELGLPLAHDRDPRLSFTLGTRF